MKYSTLDTETQLSYINARIHDLERQHLDVSLRVEAPSLDTQNVQTQEQTKLDMLTAGLEKLCVMRDALQPPTPTT